MTSDLISKGHRQMFRSALLILSGNAAASLLLLARNLLVARLIPVADYGITATFAVAMAIVEMMSQLGLHQQIIQAKNGEDPRFQAALQGFQVLRGIITGVVLFLLAGPLADFLRVPQAAWAYQVMAVVPILNALTHFDIHRLNRSMVFLPVILTGTMPALISLVAIWPLAMLYGDYTVMLYAIVIQAIMTVVTSHLFAQRPYRLVFDRAIMAHSLKFGWPLLVNGILLFAVFNGDKIIVGRTLGMETLAIFALGFNLTLAPTLVIGKSVQNFFLPQLSAARDDVRFNHLMNTTFESCFILSLTMLLTIAYIGKPFVDVVLGEKYAELIPILTWLAILQTVRIFKGGASAVALSKGQTSNAMIANTVRVVSLPIAWWSAVHFGDLMLIIWIAIASETLGFVIAMLLVRWRLTLSIQKLLIPITLSATVIGLIVFKEVYPTHANIDYAILLAFLASIFSMRNLWKYIRHKKTE